MKLYHLLLISHAISLSAHGALLMMPITVSPLGGSQSFQLTDNTGASISVSGETMCTRDIPVSTCISSTIVRGGDNVEFLLSDSGSVIRLTGGDILSDQPSQGSWGANFFNRYSFQASRSSPRDGTFSSVATEFIIGFRVAQSDGSYQYAWLEWNPDSASFGTLAFNDTATDSLIISPVPEPSSVLFVALASIATTRRIG